jgi:methylmalonyl-CoA mutase C-terminal domain/subunit
MAKEKRVRVLMAKPGVDGHYRGMLVVSMALRSAGFEVIYGGNMSPPEIASTAAQEDVDVVGLSILTGDVKAWVSDTIKELKEHGKGNILLLLGGLIFEHDAPELKKMGVHGIFTARTPLNDIVEFVDKHTSAENRL